MSTGADRSWRALIVERIGPLATVQDRGRPGLARYGVPIGGALDHETMEAALCQVGTDSALELPLLGARFRAIGDQRISIDGESPRELAHGDVVELERGNRAVRYLAACGGIDVPRVLGSRSTLVSARIGGLDGRALRVGDVVPIARRNVDVARSSGEQRDRESVDSVSNAILDALPCADVERWILEALARATFRVAASSDRVGTRLEGSAVASVPPALAASRPLVRGAVQLPSDGHPIVIGPDGPTTGGYPVVAVLTRAACARLARLRPGKNVTFRIAAPS